MNRREFIRRGALLSAATASIARAQQPEATGVKAAVITHAGGAHLDIYFKSLAHISEVTSVVLADPDGNAESNAGNVLGAKLTDQEKRDLVAYMRQL